VQPTRMLGDARSFARTVPVVTAPQRSVRATFLERSSATTRLRIQHHLRESLLVVCNCPYGPENSRQVMPLNVS
jgi:hypothetical protein